ncbi:MAG: cupin domain-containing protein, partial [Candidatus Tectomicrobia bacterium]|nr:cupin domain-containing protein [Candidatus Tectomicrobia bacterium]
RNVLYRFHSNYTWEHIPVEEYKPGEGDWKSIIRQVIVGKKGESTAFELRYFEIEPGGYSSLEKHLHEHVIIAVRGKGEVLAGCERHQLAFLDTVYISPDQPHQLLNPYSEPFGFFCIVNRDRDRPRPLSEEEREQLRPSPPIPTFPYKRGRG